MWRVVSEQFRNASRIFPTQQRDVYEIIRRYSSDINVKKLIVFGSSITSACNPWSDIDLYVEMDINKNLPPTGVRDVAVDVWTNFTVDKYLYNEIKKGVTAYERDCGL